MKKTAFVTGADRGVGLALAAHLLEDGYTVFAGQYLPGTESLHRLKQQYENQLHVLHLDVSNSESVAEALQITSKLTDYIDLLINNAAILGDIQATVMETLDYSEMMEVFNVNALGSLRMSQTFMQLLMKSDTKFIVNISSEAGSIGNCHRDSWYAYCMSKAALNMQSKLIHNGINPQGGRVLVMHPGWVMTYMQGKLDANAALTPEQSACSILEVVKSRIALLAENAECEYVDYAGNSISW